MDSFLEEPRTTPKPTPVIQSIETPTVPEVSLMFQNSRKDKSSPVIFGKHTQSYNAWKLRTNSNNNEFDSFLLAAGNKENNAPDKIFLTNNSNNKKQVRFQNPIYKSASAPTFMNTENVLPYKKTIENNSLKHVFNNDSYQLFPSTSNDTLKRLETLGINNTSKASTQQFINSPKSSNNAFESVYCSGIPPLNKELELSFLEPQKNPCPRQEYYKRSISDSPSKKLLNYVDHYNTSSTSIQHNYISQPDNNNKKIEEPETCTTVNNNNNNSDSVESENKTAQQPENVVTDTDINKKKSVDDSPTVNDLLQIIKLQNDQLQRLQNQVEILVKLSEKEKPETINKNVVTYRDQQVGTSTSLNEVREETSCLQKNEDINGKKISVGMMTSFEVSFKPPLVKKKNKTKLRNLTPVADFSNNYCSTTTTSAETQVPYQKQQRYEEEPRNPWLKNNHRRNNETEYSLGSGQSLEVQEQPESPENSIHIDMQDYDTESEDSDDECSTDGWTFYKDILGQVNNILENSNRPAYRSTKQPNKRNALVPTETETALEQIQQNTLRRLQNDGFLQQNEQCAIRPNEISFAVKQILMKYLPDDGLAEAVTKNNTDKRKPTDISVTAVKYMQQCNVITNAPQYYGRKQKNTTKNKISQSDPKILDITTLKQQPKLL